MKLKDLVRLRLFDESRDVGDGPNWAKWLFILAAAISFGSTTLGLVSAVAGKDPTPFLALMVMSQSMVAGASFHLGMPGRAWNGIVLAVVMAGILCLMIHYK
ncbi:hypothetical protein [Ralstonia pseudosolanacearum]|uniref:Uncharacterized protein n=1 Tax=Ralstonia pseudosolanacearum TaxID=1310165 RepID=A0A454TLN4_9RALS|nr:hypothetical protein [Ralstonia pseudosolanacearum]RNM03016.1 hypothetical protein EGA29_19785 [Ralstonia pseudosolanacearum]